MLSLFRLLKESALRQTPIKRHIQRGESPKDVYTSLNRSKKWFFKWLIRYRTGAAGWFKEQSRAPKTRPSEIDEGAKKRILLTRQQLVDAPYAQIGVSAIKWELKKQGLPFPSDSTINRVLKRKGLVKKTAYASKGVEYPYFTEALGCNNIHQMGLVGPRYIKDDRRFYALHVIDLFSHEIYTEAQRTKEPALHVSRRHNRLALHL